MSQIEVIIPTRGNASKKVNAEVLSSEELDVGGDEGIKKKVELMLLGVREGEKSAKISETFFTKQYILGDEGLVKKLVNTYRLLRSKGFIVPKLVRYAKVENKILLIMSDLTEGGKYLLFGLSDSMHESQDDELDEMQLSKVDLKEIQEMLDNLADKATDERIRLFWFYIHLRKHKETGKFDLCLLDVLTEVTAGNNSPIKLLNHNNTAATIFINRITKERGRRY